MLKSTKTFKLKLLRGKSLAGLNVKHSFIILHRPMDRGPRSLFEIMATAEFLCFYVSRISIRCFIHIKYDFEPGGTSLYSLNVLSEYTDLSQP